MRKEAQRALFERQLTKIHNYENALREINKATDALMKEVCKMYGGESMTITIPIPDVNSKGRIVTERDAEKGIYKLKLVYDQPEEEDGSTVPVQESCENEKQIRDER